MKIELLQKFLDSEKENCSEVTILDPIPLALEQNSYTCGYNALSIITNYWFKKNCLNPPYQARKNGNKSIISVRELGKSVVPTTNAIFDMNYFTGICEKTDAYSADVYEFDTLSECNNIIKKALQSGYPIIFPIDSGNPVGMAGGHKAHYVTLVGLIECENGDKDCVIISSDDYYIVSLNRLYNSCMNLREYPEKTLPFRRKPNSKKPKTFTVPKTDLSGMRGKLAIPYPLSDVDTYGKLQETLHEDWKLNRPNLDSKKQYEEAEILMLFASKTKANVHSIWQEPQNTKRQKVEGSFKNQF